jgi:hypothetical protein
MTDEEVTAAARLNDSKIWWMRELAELFHFCELGQASTGLPPTSAQVRGERREQTL